MYSVSADSEAAAEGVWHSGVQSLWTGIAGLVRTDTNLTHTSTSTMGATWHQTTKTQTLNTSPGTGTGQGLPYSTCCVVTLRTAQATRYGHGRIYLPAFDVGALDVAGYHFSTTTLTTVASAMNSAFVQWLSALQFVILHRKGTKNGPGPLTTDPVVASDVSDLCADQRRRGDKRVPVRQTITL